MSRRLNLKHFAARPDFNWIVLFSILLGLAGALAPTFLQGRAAVEKWRGDGVEQSTISLAQAQKIALAYYIQKYEDTNVSVAIRPIGGHFQAYIKKKGIVIKKLSIDGNQVTEIRRGMRDWIIDQFVLVN